MTAVLERPKPKLGVGTWDPETLEPCWVCGEDTVPMQAVPVSNGEIIVPDSHAGDWAPKGCCIPCYDAQQKLPTPMTRAQFCNWAGRPRRA